MLTAATKTVDRILAFRDERFPVQTNCACRLRVWQLKNGSNVVMATELEPSPGASVTNTAETWAAEACRQYNLNPFKTIFIENYDRREGTTDPSFPSESFDFVIFRWDSGKATMAKWRHAGRATVESLIGEKLP